MGFYAWLKKREWKKPDNNQKKHKARFWKRVQMKISDEDILLVVDLFDYIYEAVDYDYITEQLFENGETENPQEVVVHMINEGILQIETIAPVFYLALGAYGEDIWGDLHG